MKLRTYISLQGPDFKAREFQAQGGNAVGGQVRRRKQVPALHANDAEYWVSSTTTLSLPESVGDDLKRILVQILPLLNALPCRSTLKMYAHVVVEFEEGDEPPGMFFSNDVIRLLHEAGAELDIDAVPRIHPTG